MDRRWRGQQGQAALKTLQSFYEYRDRLPALADSQQCASCADVYSTYSCLHAAGKETQALCSPKQDLIYLQVQGKSEVRTLQSSSNQFTPHLSVKPVPQGSSDANAPDVGQDIVVPVSASFSKLNPSFLSSLLELSHAKSAGMVLALVDSDGTVVMNRLHQGILAPAEGFTGTDTLGTGKKRKKATEKE